MPKLRNRDRDPQLVVNPATAPTDADCELVARAQRDIRQFALLYARYVEAVHGYCYRRLGNREAAEDATSLIFMKALSSFPRFRDGSFRAWLFTIAHNVITDQYRQHRAESPLAAELNLADRAPSPEELAIAADEQRRVVAMLTNLPEHQRQIVELRLTGLSGGEIAQVLGRSRANIDVSQYRAVNRLRRMLDVSTHRGTDDGA